MLLGGLLAGGRSAWEMSSLVWASAYALCEPYQRGALVL